MSKKNYQIAVLGGDGTGPEVIREGKKVVEAVAKKEGFSINWIEYDLGGERYKKSGEVLPKSVVPELKKMDAIYLGAIGHPDVKPGILEKGLLLALRFELDQYINLRPVKLYPNVDFYSGLIYRAIGIPTDMFTVMFAMGRMPGWIAHWKEMIQDSTSKIGRPFQIYIGPKKRDYVPIEKR